MAPVKIKAGEMRFIDDIFESGGGWVLDFSNRTFAEFFEDELNINMGLRGLVWVNPELDQV